MPTITSGTSSIFYREVGDPGSPPVVLIHGLYGDSIAMGALASALAGPFRVISPDMIGHGQSSRLEHFTLADQGRAVNDLIAALGYESAAVVGVSMGSYVAAQAAILDEGRTSRLVLVTPKAHGKTSSVAAYAAREGIDLGAASPEEMLTLIAGAIWSPATSPERRDAILAAMPADQCVLTADERGAVERSLAGFDLRPDLPDITAPTLVISGRGDGLNPPEAGEEIAGLIPRVELTVYENSGHMLPAEEPERLVADITAFVGA